MNSSGCITKIQQCHLCEPALPYLPSGSCCPYQDKGSPAWQPSKHTEQNVLEMRFQPPSSLPALAQAGSEAQLSSSSGAGLHFISWQVQSFRGQLRQEKLSEAREQEEVGMGLFIVKISAVSSPNQSGSMGNSRLPEAAAWLPSSLLFTRVKEAPSLAWGSTSQRAIPTLA